MPHTRFAVIAAARQKNDKLKNELEKEPVKNRVSKHELLANLPRRTITSKRTPAATATHDQRNSHFKLPNTTAPPNAQRRTVNRNQSMVGSKSIDIASMRRPTITRKTLDNVNDPLTAIGVLRKAKGYSSQSEESAARSSWGGANAPEKYSVVLEQTPIIIDAIRDEGVEENKPHPKSKCSTWCDNCVASHRDRCACIAFFTALTIIACLCLIAITFPIARALLIYEHDEDAHTDNDD